MDSTTKQQRRFERHLEKSREWTLGTLKNKTATALQKAIRAEAGAFVGYVKCVVDGQMTTRFSPLGKAICVTCGALKRWKGAKAHGIDGMDAGHFLASRRNSILFKEMGLHPQCSVDNRTGGKPEAYMTYMLSVHGQEVVDELQRLKDQDTVKFSREELVGMRIEYMDRWKLAERKMKS